MPKDIEDTVEILSVSLPRKVIRDVKAIAIEQQRSISNMVSIMLQKELYRKFFKDPVVKTDK